MSAIQYEIKSGHFSAAVRQLGAELCSLSDLSSGREYIWQADPAIWAGSAPILFPIVGRLKDDAYEFAGRHYSMPGHGIVRRRQFKLREYTASSVSLGFVSDSQSRESYPFDFDLLTVFRLFNARLVIEYTVRNSGSRPMPFTIGSHPAFSLNDDAQGFADYKIEFSRPETLDRYQLDGTLIGQSVQPRFLDNERFIQLTHDIFDNDALIFKRIDSQTVSLVHQTAGREVSVDTGGAPHLGIWSKPGARFVCIEPWHGYSDSVTSTGRLQDKLGMKWLDPGYSFDAGYSISVA